MSLRESIEQIKTIAQNKGPRNYDDLNDMVLRALQDIERRLLALEKSGSSQKVP
jgi:hypothetical protein